MNDIMISEGYFHWLCDLIAVDNIANYSNLLNTLYKTDFNYIMERDANRYEDGIELRYRFGYENDISEHIIASELDYSQCSILEMMVALAIKCEGIADNPEFGNRTPIWFWGMIENLGLLPYSDDRYDALAVTNIINRFLNRNYEKNGKGGLFTVKNHTDDMRYVEIWFQAMWYLNNQIEGEE